MPRGQSHFPAGGAIPKKYDYVISITGFPLINSNTGIWPCFKGLWDVYPTDSGENCSIPFSHLCKKVQRDPLVFRTDRRMDVSIVWWIDWLLVVFNIRNDKNDKQHLPTNISAKLQRALQQV